MHIDEGDPILLKSLQALFCDNEENWLFIAFHEARPKQWEIRVETRPYSDYS